MSLNKYAHQATEQQRKSMIGQGVPLNFIRDLESGFICIDKALENVKSYVAADNADGYKSADVSCALAAVHFVIAMTTGSSEELLNEIRDDFITQMHLYFKLCKDQDLEVKLYTIVNNHCCQTRGL